MFKVCNCCKSQYAKPPSKSYKAWQNSKYCSRVCMQIVNPGSFVKGVSSWNKGLKSSPETKKKISLVQTGRKKSEQSKEKQRQNMLGRKITWADKISKSSIGKPATRKGETHWNWKGGKTKELTKLRNSSQYKRWRKSVFERDEYTCTFCGQKGGWLEADHIKQFAYYEDLRFDVNNGRTLCVDCHKKTDTYGWKGRVYA